MSHLVLLALNQHARQNIVISFALYRTNKIGSNGITVFPFDKKRQKLKIVFALKNICLHAYTSSCVSYYFITYRNYKKRTNCERFRTKKQKQTHQIPEAALRMHKVQYRGILAKNICGFLSIDRIMSVGNYERVHAYHKMVVFYNYTRKLQTIRYFVW